MFHKLFSYTIVTILISQVVKASLGDQLDEFQRCVLACRQKTCGAQLDQDNSNNEFLSLNYAEMPIALPLKLLFWNCDSNCDYQCQDVINIIRKQNNEELYQFHGKWFFIRYFYIQEPASCIFSILNFVSHYLGLKILNQEIIKFRKLNLVNNLKYVNDLICLFDNYKIMSKITICAWTFSTIFHLRDLDVTEKLDYFFAGATVLSGLYIASIRLFKLYDSPGKIMTVRLVIGFFYACHVIRLLIDWSYTYNMQINILWAVIQYGQWAYFSITSYLHYSEYLFKKDFRKKQIVEKIYRDMKRPFKEQEEKAATAAAAAANGDSVVDKISSWLTESNRNKLHIAYLKYQPNSENIKCLLPIALSIWVSCGLIFEIFDFPPWKDLVDAHSLWHLTTILPGYFWYYWMVWDGGKLKEQLL